MRSWRALVISVALFGCGTSASVGTPGGGDVDASAPDGGSSSASGDVNVIPDTPATGVVKQKSITIRSASVRFEATRKVLTLRDFASNCGVVQGALPGKDAVTVLVVFQSNGPGEETIAFADAHSATFQLGDDPSNVQTFPAQAGKLRFDTFSTNVGDVVKGALTLQGEAGYVKGTFEATVCAP